MSEQQLTQESARTDNPAAEGEIVLVSAGVGTPSSTTTLATQIGEGVRRAAARRGRAERVSLIALRDLSADLGTFNGTGRLTEELRSALDRVARARAVVAATPVYKGAMSGLFKSFWDAAPDDVAVGKPVILAATAGTPRHSLVPDSQMRELFAYLRALPLPTSVFAATDDLAAPGLLQGRIDRASEELALLLELDPSGSLRTQMLTSRNHDDVRGQVDRGGDSFEMDTYLMRLATGRVS